MKDRRDLVRSSLRKAESDLLAVTLALDAEATLDTACFHARQGAEKVLKAYLLAHNVAFPFTHNLARLLTLCQTRDPSFAALLPLAELLTPYAVEPRYDVYARSQAPVYRCGTQSTHWVGIETR